jgi:hypothetical protein
MLQQRQVELLLIAEGARFTAGLCPLCRRLSTRRRSCELDGTVLMSVDPSPTRSNWPKTKPPESSWCATSSTH